MRNQLLDIAPLAIFAFGAITFSTLTISYWGHRRKGAGNSTILPVFTLVSAAAFLNGFAYLFFMSNPAAAAILSGVILARNLLAGLLAPLMAHLVFEAADPARRFWRWGLSALYAAGVLAAAAKGADEAGLVSLPGSAALRLAPAVMLASAAVFGLGVAAMWRPKQSSDRAYRRWTAVLLAPVPLCAAAGGYLGRIPDYLLLILFGVTLYYRERLVFFDVLVKRGLYLAAGLVVFTLWVAAAPPASPWPIALALLAAWIAGPWLHARLARAIDYAWLRRRYSPVEAERRFLSEIQTAVDESDLRTRAAASLDAIFRAVAEVNFEAAPGEVSDRRSLAAGHIRLAPRPDGIPYLSDDARLLQSLAGALAVVLENVRFRVERRAQEQREQQLRWLAGRAELRALRAQINPHFLFNTLSAIAGLLHYQPALAEETIEQLARVFRYTLRKSECEWSPLADEVEFVTAYLRIEQARFGDRLSVEIEVDPAVSAVPIPSMTIQPLIENAIRHGVSASADRGRVSLRAALRDGALAIEVGDNGPGFPSGFSLDAAGEGHGLRNVRDRLRGYYGEAARLSWESNGTGARVLLILPCAC